MPIASLLTLFALAASGAAPTAAAAPAAPPPLLPRPPLPVSGAGRRPPRPRLRPLLDVRPAFLGRVPRSLHPRLHRRDPRPRRPWRLGTRTQGVDDRRFRGRREGRRGEAGPPA